MAVQRPKRGWLEFFILKLVFGAKNKFPSIDPHLNRGNCLMDYKFKIASKSDLLYIFYRSTPTCLG